MIKFIDKGPGLQAAIAEAGHYLALLDGVWTSNDDDAVQQIIDSFDQLSYERAELLKQIADDFESKVAKLKAGYPASELLSWDKQEIEARAHLSGGAPSVLIARIAEKRAESTQLLAQKIVSKANAFSATIGDLIGERHAREKRAEEAGSVDEIMAIRDEISGQS